MHSLEKYRSLQSNVLTLLLLSILCSLPRLGSYFPVFKDNYLYFGIGLKITICLRLDFSSFSWKMICFGINFVIFVLLCFIWVCLRLVFSYWWLNTFYLALIFNSMGSKEASQYYCFSICFNSNNFMIHWKA